jgi:hypothetical protein
MTEPTPDQSAAITDPQDQPQDHPTSPARRRANRDQAIAVGRRILAAARVDPDFRSRSETVVLALLVLLPMLVTGIALLPEMTAPIPSVNDDSLHYLFIQNASNALSAGQSLFDQWLPQIDLGFPQFLYYQNLPHLVVIAIQRALLGSVDLLTVFNVIRWLLLVTFPLTVYWSMRRMGFSQVASAIAAAVGCLLSDGQLYGFAYDSYIWRGWGMYTQLWAMHLSFITIACVYRGLTTGRGLALAAIALAALVLSHVIYAYIVAVSIVVLLLVGLTRANLAQRLVRLAVIGIPAALITSYMTVPFLSSLQYDNVTPYLQSYKYDSYGAETILGWLVGGQLWDAGRLPVLTALFAVGVIAALVARRRVAIVALAIFAVFLLLYFGKPTLGPLIDLLPLHASLLFHRFIGGVDIGAIILMGVGGAVLWAAIAGAGTGRRVLLAGLVGLVVLAPVLQERLTFYGFNTQLIERSQAAIAADADATTILTTLKTLPAGRVYAGLPATYAPALHDADVPFYDRLLFEGIDAVPPPSESLSLNSDYIWDFNDHNPGQFDLYNIRYVVAPTNQAVADFMKPIKATPTYTLYEVPTSGYAEYVTISSWEPIPSQTALFARNRPWVNSSAPAAKSFVAYDYPSTATTPTGGPEAGCPDGGRILFQAKTDDSFTFTVACPAAAPLVIKTTYHPNWQVQVDGQPVSTFMVSPSLIGLNVPAGTHTVTAQYQQTPIKTPLLILGALVLLLVVVFRRRLDRSAEWAANRLAPVVDRAPLHVPGPVVRLRGRVGLAAAAAVGSLAGVGRRQPTTKDVEALSVSGSSVAPAIVTTASAAPSTSAPTPPRSSSNRRRRAAAAAAVAINVDAPVPAAVAPATGWRATVHQVRLRAFGRLTRTRWLVAVGLASLLAALLADRFAGIDGPWLWNAAMPAQAYPFASMFHDALAAGRLPIWNAQLGLGYPLYAGGPIGAFYIPNWLIFQLPPLVALDVARIAHLVLLGFGTALLAFRMSGSRIAAIIAAAAVVLIGGLVVRLGDISTVEAFAWLPWVLLPLMRRPAPTRYGLFGAGLALGIQALTSAPNTWVLTGICAALVLIAVRPHWDALLRLGTVVLVAVAVGLAQLLPTAVVWLLADRTAGVPAGDPARLTAMPFDLLGVAFANVFAPAVSSLPGVDQSWYPGGAAALQQVAAYVGLPVLAFAACGLASRRARPCIAIVVSMVLIPLVAGINLGPLDVGSFWNAFGSPIESYLFLDFGLVVLAAIGIGRLLRGRARWRPAAVVVGGFVAAYALLLVVVAGLPSVFEGLVRAFWAAPGPDQAPIVVQEATTALTAFWPVLSEIVLGVLAVALIYRRVRGGAAIATAALLVLAPMAILTPGLNQSQGLSGFSERDAPLIRAIAAAHANRVLTTSELADPAGLPAQLAAAGIGTMEAPNQLPLSGNNATLDALRRQDPGQQLARALGVDTVVAAGSSCPGEAFAQVPGPPASTVCRLSGALQPPYWVPASAVSIPADTSASPFTPADAQLVLPAALDSFVPAAVASRTDTGGLYLIQAPSDGYLFIDRSWWPMWQTTVDSVPQPVYRVAGGQLVFVPAGRHVIGQTLIPWDALGGLLVGLLVGIAVFLWARRAPRAMPWLPASMRSSWTAPTRPVAGRRTSTRRRVQPG